MNSIETSRPPLRSWRAWRRAATLNPQSLSFNRTAAPTFTLIGFVVAFATIAILPGMFSPAQAQTTFTKITTGPVVTDAADGQGCAWVDFDNDGDLDLYVSCNRTGASLLYRNDGNGVFTRITTGPIVNAGVGSVSASWADLDNDGLIDLFVSRQSGGSGLLFRQQAGGTFTQSTLPLGLSYGAAWADYEGADFLQCASSGRHAADGDRPRSGGGIKRPIVSVAPVGVSPTGNRQSGRQQMLAVSEAAKCSARVSVYCGGSLAPRVLCSAPSPNTRSGRRGRRPVQPRRLRSPANTATEKGRTARFNCIDTD